MTIERERHPGNNVVAVPCPEGFRAEVLLPVLVAVEGLCQLSVEHPEEIPSIIAASSKRVYGTAFESGSMCRKVSRNCLKGGGDPKFLHTVPCHFRRHSPVPVWSFRELKIGK